MSKTHHMGKTFTEGEMVGVLMVVSDLLGALQWAGGSDDFAPGGQAETGWKVVAEPALRSGTQLLHHYGYIVPGDENVET